MPSAQQFAGYFEGEFWSKLVLQVSYREPCVRHIIIALGSLYESFQNDYVGPATSLVDTKNWHKYAVGQYTKAIRLLNAYILAQGWGGLEVTLLCCILFTGFEWLRGSYLAAQRHLRSGLSILRQWQANGALVVGGTSFWSPSGISSETS